ncbi:GNAT family N-acetyltransferase [Saccharothrix deserti]|uniref:GNAT family N-acetyltransferase n=1 Tax=Saccharothrix deserti TaxID=2593674 RepID=UPI00131B6159|nr:GNAT family N-acetyltransferase [Saccharothrix deserti]
MPEPWPVLSGFGELRTGRLSLRRPVIGDLDAVHEIQGDPVALAHNPADAVHSRDQADVLLKRWMNHWRGYGFGYWAVRRLGAERTLGFCGVKVSQVDERRALNLFYRFSPASWGDGISTEAAHEVVRWATEHLGAFPVVARVRPANTASQRVALKAGLGRAEHLDRDGEDGPDLLFTAGWAPSPPVKGPIAH